MIENQQIISRSGIHLWSGHSSDCCCSDLNVEESWSIFLSDVLIVRIPHEVLLVLYLSFFHNYHFHKSIIHAILTEQYPFQRHILSNHNLSRDGGEHKIITDSD